MKSAPRGRLTSLALVLAMLALPVASFAADEGADLFKSKCAMCHGLDGAGKTLIGEKLKIPDLHSADVQKKSDTDLQTILAKGQGKMPDRDCTVACVRGGSKYVLVSDGKVLQIANQDNKDLAAHAGHTVKMTGELKGSSITVSKIEMQ